MKDIEELKNELATIEMKIEKLQPKNDYLDRVYTSFPLGMVGGSGRNTHGLNKRREQSLNKTIDNAVLLCPLYTKRDNLKKQIEDIESGKTERKENNIIESRILMAKWWNNLKPGDELPIRKTGNPIILKKNKVSVETQGGCKWTATEIIGREAAKLI